MLGQVRATVGKSCAATVGFRSQDAEHFDIASNARGQCDLADRWADMVDSSSGSDVVDGVGDGMLEKVAFDIGYIDQTGGG